MHCPAELLVVKSASRNDECDAAKVMKTASFAELDKARHRHSGISGLTNGGGFLRSDCAGLTWGTIQKYLQNIPR